MTTALAILYHLESIGCQLKAQGGSIRFRAPDGVLSDPLKKLVREHKPEFVKMLESRRKFGYREASLLPLIGRSVTTAQGQGELLSVHRRYCRLQLHRTGGVVLCRPVDLISLAVSEFMEEEAA